MRKNSLSSESGMSLIEIMIVLVIVGIVVASAVLGLGKSKTIATRQNVMRELKVSLERARFDSVKRRPDAALDMARVVIDSATKFTVFSDRNQDGILSAGESRAVNFNQGGITFVGDNLIYPIVIAFDRRGRAIASDGSNNTFNSGLTICNNCTTQTANESNAQTLFVSSTGTVAVVSTGDALPIYANPTVTNVNSGDEINNWVTVNDGDSIYPIITPSPTPNGTPNPSPTVTPNPSPTVTPSPSPNSTPLPKACVYNEKPSTTGCVCLLPKTVRSNKKCQ